MAYTYIDEEYNIYITYTSGVLIVFNVPWLQYKYILI